MTRANTMPEAVASYSTDSPQAPIAKGAGTIWIDLENTPHIPFFNPIIRRLNEMGYDVRLTARDAYQTCEMARLYGFTFKKVGRHYGKRRVMKSLGVILRAAQLMPFARQTKPILALNHGSRTQNLACNLLRIPTIGMMDYEHAAEFPLLCPTWELMPEAISPSTLQHVSQSRIRTYPGIKEDVYVGDLKPDPSLLTSLGLRSDAICVTIRPPATEAHYHNREAELLLEAVMKRILEDASIDAVILPRSKHQENQLRQQYPDWFSDSRVKIPKQVVDGLNLLWFSDLAISGGGTMNREAAALRIPVYSIFRGKIGAVDRQLAADGRLTLLETTRDVENRIEFKRRSRPANPGAMSRPALDTIISHINEITRLESSRKAR